MSLPEQVPCLCLKQDPRGEGERFESRSSVSFGCSSCTGCSQPLAVFPQQGEKGRAGDPGLPGLPGLKVCIVWDLGPSHLPSQALGTRPLGKGAMH